MTFRVHREGYAIVAGAIILLGGVQAYLFFALPTLLPFWIFLPFSIGLIFMTYHFFLNPDRPYEGTITGSVVAAADGNIVVIEKAYEPEMLQRECLQISTFMTLMDIHANWIPVEGVVRKVEHVPGNFLAAYLPKSSIENEHTTTLIETPEGHEVVIKQVAGALARRVINYAKPGDEAHLGRELGFIRFGSRTDIFLPLESEVLVQLDQKVWGNITTLARLPQSQV